MEKKSKTERLEFLQNVWQIMLTPDTSVTPNVSQEYLGVKNAQDFFTKTVYSQLLRLDKITIAEISLLTQKENAVEETYAMVIKTLNNTWHMITPKAKVQLVDVIRKYNLTKMFDKNLQLTEEEESALRIRWDISDILYFEKKREAINECITLGYNFKTKIFDFTSNNLPTILDESKWIIINLLRNKLKFDIAVVLIETSLSRQKYHAKIRHRLLNEFILWLDMLREPLHDFAVTFEKKDPTGWAESRLEEFKQMYESLEEEISTIQPNPIHYACVRELNGNDQKHNARNNQPSSGEQNMISKIVIAVIILVIALGGFWILPIEGTILWLIFLIAGYPLALAFTTAKQSMDNTNLVGMYKAGLKQIPIIGKFFVRKH